MGRELRKVPANWEHPKKSDGSWQPMHDEYYGNALNEWLNDHNKWEDGTHPDLIKYPEYKEEYPFYAMYGGNPPNVDYYRTKQYLPEELTHIQLYESTTEGTPLSPVFGQDQLEELCEWAAENASVFAYSKATKEQWMNMLKNDLVYHQEGNVIFL